MAEQHQNVVAPVLPKAQMPKAPTPKAPTPKAPTPKAQMPKMHTPKAQMPKMHTPKAPTPKAPTPNAPAPNAQAEAPSVDSVKLYKGMRVGSRAQVWHGTADITAPSKKGLKKPDLTMNPRGHIVSKKQRAAGTKAFNRLRELGYAPVAGKPFVAFTKKNVAPKKSPSRKQRDSRKSRKQRSNKH